jgi:putative PIN family toxin of toxin-antitoxin system
MMRVVLDTNVVVSGIIHPAGIPGKLLAVLLKEQRFLLVTSPLILREIGEVLLRPKSVHYHRWGEADVSRFLARLYDLSVVTSDRLIVEVITEDPPDNLLLAAAKEGEASYIVSGDHHLLQLGSYEGIYILTPRAFFDILISS